LTHACHFADYLLHALCIRQGDYVYGHCIHQYQQKIGAVQAKVNDQDKRPANETSAEDDSDLRTVCW